MTLSKKIEIWDAQYAGLWFELHVDATEERRLIDLFCETVSGVTDDAYTHFEELISKIDN
jgi:hypothetical protein